MSVYGRGTEVSDPSSSPPALKVLVGKIRRILSTDFCPGYNKYVYWLKEPAGWFACGLLFSVLVGLFASPLGWTIAGALVVLLATGLVLPWLIVRFTYCSLAPSGGVVRENEPCSLKLVIKNRLPIPLWGLLIENYASLPDDESFQREDSPDIALSVVPAFSAADFQLAFSPEYRGTWPVEIPLVSCAFPFGLWKAKKPLSDVRRLRVWPRLLPVMAEFEPRGRSASLFGDGQRTGSAGQYLGVREFRMGDSLKDIRWSLSARLDELVVIERSSPEVPVITLEISGNRVPDCDDTLAQRVNLAWRVRIAASLASYFHSRRQPPSLLTPFDFVAAAAGPSGLSRIMDALTDIPLDPIDPAGVDTDRSTVARSGPVIAIAPVTNSRGYADMAALVRITMTIPRSFERGSSACFARVINLDEDIGSQLDNLIQEADHASIVRN